MKLSQSAAYAIQAVVYLADLDAGAPVPCSRIAADANMPERYLLQVLRSLVRAGVLRSTRGVEGGYLLQRTPSEVTLLHIVEAVGGDLSTHVPPCPLLSDDGVRRIRQALDRAAQVGRQELNRLKVADLLHPRS